MNLMQLPLRLQAGRLMFLRLEQLPADQRARTSCPCGTADTGWRIQTEPCDHSHAFHALNALWQRLACATHTPRMLADLLIIQHLLPMDGSFTISPLPPRWHGRDVRPWLGNPAARQHLLQSLAPHQREARRLLAIECVEAAQTHTSPTAASASASASASSSSAAHHWLPWLPKNRSAWTADLEAAASILNQGHEPDREALIATWLQSHAHAWLPLLSRQPAALHLPLLRILMEAKQHLQPPPAGMHMLLTTLHHLTPPAAYEKTLTRICLSLANGCSTRFLARSLHYHVEWKLEFQTHARPVHEPRRRQLRLILHGPSDSWLRNPAQVWKHATGLQHWSSAIQRLLAHPLEKDLLNAVLGSLQNLERKRRRDATTWARWLHHWDDMLRELHATPRPKRKLAADLISAWRTNSENPARAVRSVPQMLRWLQRLREFEKHPGENIPSIIHALWNRIEPQEEEAMLQVPEKTWRQMQPALLGWSSLTNAVNGLWWADKLPVGCLTAMLRSAPLTWVRTMRRIGELTCPERRQLWEAFREHPLTSCNTSSTPLPHLIVLVDAIHASHPNFPGVPDKLRSSTSSLHEHVKAHYLEELTRNIHRLRLAVLEDLAEWALRRRFPMLAGSHVITHTLRVAAAADDNRRHFRRLLRACEQKQDTREWTLSHPANQQWLRSLSPQRANLWNEGFIIEREVSGVGTVRLGPEDNLQAILRMGTDFGTCLSAGSFNSFSTVANALDANKRVLYAVDVEGRIWARQLLAISETGHLVCFAVYARRSHAAMRQLFSAYDHTLAQSLRLPLWLSRHDSAPIAKIVCKEWYDDGIWRP